MFRSSLLKSLHHSYEKQIVRSVSVKYYFSNIIVAVMAYSLSQIHMQTHSSLTTVSVLINANDNIVDKQTIHGNIKTEIKVK